MNKKDKKDWVPMNKRLPSPHKPVVVKYHFKTRENHYKAIASGYYLNGSFHFHDSLRQPSQDCTLIAWKYTLKSQ